MPFDRRLAPRFASSSRVFTLAWAVWIAGCYPSVPVDPADSGIDAGVDASLGCPAVPCTGSFEVCASDGRCVCGPGSLRDELAGACVPTVSPCASLVAPLHGSITASTALPGSSIGYACDDGYVLAGNGGSATRECLAGAVWAGSDPTCEPIPPTCPSNPCAHGGACTVDGASLICSCVNGWSGPTCETQAAGSVGDPCDAAADCTSPTAAACLNAVMPLAGIPPEQVVNPSAYDAAAGIGLTFANGYCSSEPNCASDADCGPAGACFRPFTNVTDDTLRELEIPLGVETGALQYLPSFGVCMRSCVSALDCAYAQICAYPMPDFVSLIPGSINDTTYCVPDPNCSDGVCPCSPNPCLNGGTCTASSGTAVCDCAPGWGGDHCETAATIPIGGRCTADAQCNVPSTTFGPAVCLSSIHPLAPVTSPTDSLHFVGLDFPNGYCSNTPNCLSNTQCGANGHCWAPFRNVTEQTLRDLEATFIPPLATGALDYLSVLGHCLRKCNDSLDCAPDQACALPMDDFVSLVPGSVNTQTTCVTHEDCEFCAANAYCQPDPASPSNASCVCRPGYTGNGLVCDPI